MRHKFFVITNEESGPAVGVKVKGYRIAAQSSKQKKEPTTSEFKRFVTVI